MGKVGSGAVVSATHKDYIKSMLIQKLHRKISSQIGSSISDDQVAQIINSEVLNFIRNEKITRESLK